MEGWIQWGFGQGFRLYSRFFVVSRSFLVACFVCRLGFAFGDDGKDEEEDGGSGKLRASHQVAGKELWRENGTHHDKATHLSGYVTGLGLLRLCITPSTRLKNLPWTASDTTIQTETSRIIISSLSFFSVLFLSSSQSTILLRLLSPYAPRNETSNFVASYGRCNAIS